MGKIRRRSEGGRPTLLLVAAGVGLRGYQHEARASGLRLGWTAEAVQDAEDYGVRGQNSKSNRGDYRKENNQRH